MAQYMTRRAFGHQRPTTPAQRARYIAESMQAHGLDIEAADTWSRYGIAEDSELGKRVIAALCRMYDETYCREPLLDRM